MEKSKIESCPAGLREADCPTCGAHPEKDKIMVRSQRLFQIHHVDQLHPVLVDGVVIMVDKEVRQAVRDREPAVRVNREDAGCFPRADIQCRTSVPVGMQHVPDECLCISLALMGGNRCEVLQFKVAVSLISDHADGPEVVVEFPSENLLLMGFRAKVVFSGTSLSRVLSSSVLYNDVTMKYKHVHDTCPHYM